MRLMSCMSIALRRPGFAWGERCMDTRLLCGCAGLARFGTAWHGTDMLCYMCEACRQAGWQPGRWAYGSGGGTQGSFYSIYGFSKVCIVFTAVCGCSAVVGKNPHRNVEGLTFFLRIDNIFPLSYCFLKTSPILLFLSPECTHPAVLSSLSPLFSFSTPLTLTEKKNPWNEQSFDSPRSLLSSHLSN